MKQAPNSRRWPGHGPQARIRLGRVPCRSVRGVGGVGGLVRRRGSEVHDPSRIVRTELLVTGMHGNACRERLEEALRAIAGVEEVEVSLHRGWASILHGAWVARVDLVNAVRRVGCAAEGIPDTPR